MKNISDFEKPTGWSGRKVIDSMNEGHRPLTEWGLDKISIPDHGQVIDIGCGGGMAIHLMAEKNLTAFITGVDHSALSVQESLKYNKARVKEGRVNIFQASVSALPFSDDQFDMALSVESHFFWPRLEKDLSEVKRILKPGGKLYLLFGVYKHPDYDDRNLQWVRETGLRYLSKEELQSILEGSGFSSVNLMEDYDKGWLLVEAH